MLASALPSVRLGRHLRAGESGQRLPGAVPHPDCRVALCVRKEPAWRSKGQGPLDPDSHRPPLREDVQAAITAIGDRSKRGLNYENARGFRLDLSGAWLTWARLPSANLSNADLTRANLHHANLRCADLSRADLGGADLQAAWLKDADLSGAHIGPDILPDPSGEQIGDIEYIVLTQAQLDEAKADPNNQPKLDPEAVDHTTGKQLVWRG